MINFDAFVKYSKPGPRYTSYPTALEFSDEFNYDEYTKRLRNGDKNRPLSLYFHLPFCRSACYFCGCNVIYTSKSDKMGRYLDYVDKELDILSTVLDTNRKVTQMHFGGGTPTFYSASELNRLIESIKRHFKNWSDDAEISCEIDPRFLNEEQLDVLTSHGFNRVSFGVQDFDEKVQKEIHRIQPFDMTKNAVDMARANGIISVNTDLIYGLPFQSLESFKNTLDLGLKLNPDRFAVFNYAHVPWIKKSMRKFDESTLPSPKVKLEILKYTMEFLTSNGYKMIGMDHYAKPEDELFHALRSGSLHRNFQGYTTKSGADLIGIGLTSIGEGEDYYAQNFKDMDGYEKAIDEGKLPNFKGVMLSEEDKLRKAVIMDLMANFALDIKAIETKFNIDFWEHFKNELNELEELKDFVEISPQKIKVNETGTLLIRNIAMCFDEYMIKFKGVKNSFSKTV
ncbi:oxygen-independent coproporphyrinogen III oxidase [Campylobacter hyointestinalis]|uniref:oxygen-independent coproporphyrinogen III oxidase n=1 Tax=Campylobacter hyointestinalis TaxID=198 RepID=UPI000CE3DC81|nr:oxygen-independent coproporphyrinogen III oxidase [Campylobacter hyointestinalis]PPB74309.1 oxygen-independent coproporphyrinogen III oxidase [Campylobacter hyointestinalis subsp. hyointestinalis]PPB75227.1 oxygen-independent coproporphyrinogen III oxidase [Campylobacter hyointestinalis subsp. hyointestinalis]PPB77550.1 oxygen-independent coproporphyrinogen III oxidase [Campylobacter hyointestinalis subsp. hyointestinalis]PPB78645.1 oxygen-independent coproporphyrinogen III oxidase [Campylob